MRHYPVRRLLAAAILGLVSHPSCAVTLGRAQGAALIGRPLDVGIVVGLDAGTEPAELCTEAEVFYGDVRVPQERVSALINATGPAGTVRVRAALPVDEPVVTVYLRLGCNQKLTRRYVLLSEQPGEVAETPRTAAAPAATARPSSGAAQGAAPAVAPPGATAPAAATGTQEPRRAARTPARDGKVAVRSAPLTTPRLKLDPLDLGVGHDPTLRLSDSLASAAEGSPQQRAEAIARWRALNAQPEDLLRSTERMQVLAQDIQSLRETMLKNDAGLAALRRQLEQAERERFANSLVYALAALLLAALAAAAYFWQRARRAQQPGEWWHSRMRAGARTNAAVATDGESLPSGVDSLARPAASQMDVDLDLDFLSPSNTAAVTQPIRVASMAPPFAPSSTSGFSASMRGEGADARAGLRAVRAEELNDIQQQADFFMSLGEYGQAVEVLRGHIQSHPEASAVAWLDLLDIFHKLQRRDDYEEVRGDFQRIFNAQAPSFDVYREETQGLEAYPHALARIQALWPSSNVLDVIEESIFRKPSGNDATEAFGLQAYRELLMLHSVGAEVVSNADPDRGAAAGFGHTQIQPLSARRDWSPFPGAEVAPKGLGSVVLDINLDEPLPPAATRLGSIEFDLNLDDLPRGHKSLH